MAKATDEAGLVMREAKGRTVLSRDLSFLGRRIPPVFLVNADSRGVSRCAICCTSVSTDSEGLIGTVFCKCGFCRA